MLRVLKELNAEEEHGSDGFLSTFWWFSGEFVKQEVLL